MTAVLESFRYAFRTMRRKPGFAALVVLILALGIGANTAMFSLVNGILIRPLEFPRPDRLYRLFHKDLQGSYQRGTVTPGNFYDWKRHNSSFDSMAAFYFTARNLTGFGEPQRLQGAGMAGNLFEVTGVAPLLGRTFRPQEQDAGADPALVLSHAAWQRYFAGEEGVLGRSFVLDDTPYAVIGVMPPGFTYPGSSSVQFWVTARWDEEFRSNRFEYFLSVLGRLKDGVTPTRAEAEMETLMSGLRQRFPDENENVTVNLVPLHEQVVGSVRARLFILMGAVGMVLLIACVNLANLFLARATSRGPEIALRQALGAGRAGLVMHVLTEAVVLGLMGALAGLLLGWAVLQLVVQSVLGSLPRVEAVGIDFWVFAFTAAAGVLSGLVFGLLPALHHVHVSPVHSLKERLRSGGNRRVRSVLVVSEVALALVLLAGAGLLIRSLALLQQVDPGISTQRLLSFRISLPSQKYDQPARARFFRESVQRLQALPDVSSAAAVSSLPVTGYGNGAWFNIVGRPVPAGKTPPGVLYRIITP
ncbi:MAG: ABC transporter permease, partial [Acidobacteriota bacterium]